MFGTGLGDALLSATGVQGGTFLPEANGGYHPQSKGVRRSFTDARRRRGEATWSGSG